MLQTTPIPATSLLSAPPPRKNLIAPTTQNCPDTQNLNFAQASAKTYPSQPPSNSRFTNNTDPNTLLNRFRDIIDNPSVQIAHLAFLIGFFRISGFKHLWDLLAPSKVLSKDTSKLQNHIQSIRILVGINADLPTANLSQLANDLANNPHKQESLFAKFKEAFFSAQAKSFANSPYSFLSEESLALLISALNEQTLEIRIIKDKSTHAKFYIFSTEAQISHATNAPSYNGSLIVGSSNLSENGLYKNYEFNLESRDSDDIAYALYEFNTLWENSVPLTPQDAQILESTIKEHTYLKECTPKEIYYKLLIEYFGINKIKVDFTLKSFFPRGFKKPDYQLTAIAEGLDKLEKYNGFFLSDVVGLGKTLIASIIAKKFESQDEGFKSLVVSPAALKANWEEHLELVKLNHRKVVSYDKLEKEVKNPQDYSLIIIDESHNLSHTATQRYKALQRICKELNPKSQKKKVILLSATPQKNSPQDIQSQLCLFQDNLDCNIENIDNLEDFFAPLKVAFSKIKKDLESAFNDDNQEKIKALKNELSAISQTIRDKLLRFVMVRRTRADIQSIEIFAKNLKEQDIIFPHIEPPKELVYDLSKKAKDLAQNTLSLLDNQSNVIGDFGYYRYLIYPNLTPKGQAKFEAQYGKSNFAIQAQSLAGLIKIIMFKRFESSIKAFESTLTAQITSLKAFLRMFSEGQIAIPKKLANLYKFYDDILDDESGAKLNEYLEKYVEKDQAFLLDKSDFVPSYEANLQSDLATLETLLSKWQEIHDDPKLDTLKSALQDFTKDCAKVIIFTEAKASADYLEANLTKHKVLKIDAQNRDKSADKIRANFDANYETQKDDYNILITTDTLAEGVNLHRSHIIINYDSPWSATKLMQRIGRINRIGTKHEHILIYNFKPSNVGDAILGFNAKAYQKLQSFHFTFGEDSAIYDESEEFGTQSLFENTIYKEQNELSEDTKFLDDIKKLYTNHPDEFERINALKPKSRTFVRNSRSHDCICFCYMKNALGNNYFYKFTSNAQNPKQNSLESSFIEMATYLKSHINAKSINPHIAQTTKHYSDIKHITHYHESQFMKKPKESLFDEIPTSKDPKITTARAKIQALANNGELSQEDAHLIISTLDKGTLANLSKAIKDAKSKKDYNAIVNLCQNKQPHQNEPHSALAKEAHIQLSISSFPKD